MKIWKRITSLFCAAALSAAMLTGCGLVITIRILSAHFRWNLPHAHD